MAGKADSNILPPKENALFKSIVKLYTSKEYKKGLKAADQVLAKFPNHGETLAMKGLILNCQEKKTEAYEYVRRGLKNNLASHVCWHTYGLLYRSDRNYLEAIKCYKSALRHDKDNMQILRDLSLLQVQMRDLEGYIETRRQILTLKPSQKAGWLAFGMAAHLLGNHKKALGILESYERTLTDEGKVGFDYSETLLYKNMLLEEDGDYEGALKHLDQVEPHIVDKQTLNEQRAVMLHKLGRYEDAEKVIRGLVNVNPDNIQFHHSLLAARLHIEPKAVPAALAASKPEDANIQALAPLYEELAKDFPKCLAVRRLPLEFLHGEAFQQALERFIQKDLRRGVPSLFIGLKSLYNNQAKRKILDTVFRSTNESLTTKGTFPGSEEKETPSTHLWGRYLFAQHLDRIGEYTQALEQVAQAVAHTPTVIELYVLKAKVLKHAGDIKGAWESYDKAREMDLADRYLNTKATLYALRADKIETAEKTIALFTSKEGADSQETLFEMQCMWYETECGLSYFRQKKYGRALKKLLAVDKHFADITEDQFDFHMYCIRKMTLRTYVKMLRLEDQLYGHKFFQKAAQAAVRTYLSVFDTPAVAADSKEDELAHLPEAERKAKLKRLKAKQEKEKARLAAEEEKKEQLAKAGGKSEKEKKTADTDPEGNTLVSADVLAEATKLLTTLHKYEKQDISTNILAFKVYIRRKKYLLAAQSLRRAIALDAQHPEVHASIVQLAHAITQLPTDNTYNETVLKVLRGEVAAYLKSSTPSAYLTTIVSSHSSSLPFLIVAAELTPLVQPENTREALARLQTIPADATLQDAERARDVLSAHGTPEDVAAFTQSAHARFPLANAFAPPAPPAPAPTPEEAQASSETDK